MVRRNQQPGTAVGLSLAAPTQAAPVARLKCDHTTGCAGDLVISCWTCRAPVKRTMDTRSRGITATHKALVRGIKLFNVLGHAI